MYLDPHQWNLENTSTVTSSLGRFGSVSLSIAILTIIVNSFSCDNILVIIFEMKVKDEMTSGICNKPRLGE